MVTCQKNLGSVGINYFVWLKLRAKKVEKLYSRHKTASTNDGLQEISKMKYRNRERLFPVLTIVKKKFFLMTTDPRWINKTLLLIKQHITYMNISRYANIDKFVNIRYIFLLARRAYSWLFQLAQMWKLLAPGVLEWTGKCSHTPVCISNLCRSILYTKPVVPPHTYTYLPTLVIAVWEHLPVHSKYTPDSR
jgi:hypothetical protein